MKGILLAGGEGTRLGELTGGSNKHLLPVDGEPMLCHGLRKFAGAGVRNLLVVCGRPHLEDLEAALAQQAIPELEIELVAQEEPGGIGQAIALCAPTIEPNREALVVLLGDNLFQEPLGDLLAAWRRSGSPARVHLSPVPDPQRFGIATLDAEDQLVGLEEKPALPTSDLAVTGIYFLPPGAAERAAAVPPSPRGEVEVLDLLRLYLKEGGLDHALLQGWWVDAGTPQSLAQAEERIRASPPGFS